MNALFPAAAAGELDRLVVGAEYVAVGPAEGSKLGPPGRIRVLEDLGDRYRVERLSGRAAVADVVHRRAARLWRPA